MHRGTAGEQSRGALRQKLTQLRDRGVRHLGHVQPRQPALPIDHEQGGRVGDLPGLDRRLDPVVLPDLLELRQRAGQEPPRVQHPVELRVGPHVLERDRGRVGIDPEQLYLRAGLAQHRLGIQHRRRRQRAHRRALRIVERQDHDLPAVRLQRDGLPELVRQREIGSHARHRSARVQVGIRGQRVRLRLSRRIRPHQDRPRPRRARSAARHRPESPTGRSTAAATANGPTNAAEPTPAGEPSERIPNASAASATSASTTIPSTSSVLRRGAGSARQDRRLSPARPTPRA